MKVNNPIPHSEYIRHKKLFEDRYKQNANYIGGMIFYITNDPNPKMESFVVTFTDPIRDSNKFREIEKLPNFKRWF